MDIKAIREKVQFGLESYVRFGSIAWADIDDLCDEVDRLEEKMRVAVEALEEYGTHGFGCMAGQGRAGRPTEDGGYETFYGYGKNAKWYKRGESPECTCGLSEALAQLKPEGEQG